jgi:peptidoglycan hydrolase-like protein with peptidoglycan-binding domain
MQCWIGCNRRKPQVQAAHGAESCEQHQGRRVEEARIARSDMPVGARTEAAVKKLQQQSGISVDGVVGTQTWPVIDALENEGPVS